MHYILHTRPDLKNPLEEAAYRIEKEGKERGYGFHRNRKIDNWLNNDKNPDLPKTPAPIINIIEQLREAMAEAFDTKSYERYFNPEFPAACQLWVEQNYRIISFCSGSSPAEQNQIFDLAFPGNKITTLNLKAADSYSAFSELYAFFPEEKNRCFLLVSSSDYKFTFAWRQQKLKTILLENQAMRPKPYLERGYSLQIGSLIDFNPDQEVQRDYY